MHRIHQYFVWIKCLILKLCFSFIKLYHEKVRQTLRNTQHSRKCNFLSKVCPIRSSHAQARSNCFCLPKVMVTVSDSITCQHSSLNRTSLLHENGPDLHWQESTESNSNTQEHYKNSFHFPCSSQSWFDGNQKHWRTFFSAHESAWVFGVGEELDNLLKTDQ